MASDILTKLYWTDGSCESGDKDLGSMGGNKICGVSKSYQDGDMGVTYITGTPKPVRGEDDDTDDELEPHNCEPGGISVFKGKNGTSDPLLLGQSHLCYVNTPNPLKDISSKDGTSCGAGNITLSSVDLGIPEEPVWNGPSKSNFGPIYPAGTGTKNMEIFGNYFSLPSQQINKVFCAPESSNSDKYKTINIQTPSFRVEDQRHPAPKYGFIHNDYKKPEDEVFCPDRSDLYSARAERIDPGKWAKAGGQLLSGDVGGALTTAFSKEKRYYNYNCRYPNALPDKDYANYRYCAYANTHTYNGNYTLSCNYTLPVSNVTLRNMDRDIVKGKLHVSAQEIYGGLVESYCEDLKEKYKDNPEVLAALQLDTSISDYLSPDGNRAAGSQLTCTHLMKPGEFCRSYSNNVVDYSGSVCSPARIGTDLYNELWTNFCEQYPSHPRCGCWAITKGNKCTTNPEIDACKTMDREYGLIQAADKRSYEVNEPNKRCFTEVCSDIYNSGVWLPPGYNDGCPDKMEICNKETEIQKHNRITAFQVLLCNDLEELAEDIPNTPEYLAALKEKMDDLIQTYLNRKDAGPDIKEEENDDWMYYLGSSFGSMVLCACCIIIIIAASGKK